MICVTRKNAIRAVIRSTSCIHCAICRIGGCLKRCLQLQLFLQLFNNIAIFSELLLKDTKFAILFFECFQRIGVTSIGAFEKGFVTR